MQEAAAKKNDLLQYVCGRAFRLNCLTLLTGALTGRVTLSGDIAAFGLAFTAAAAMSGANVHFAAAGALIGTLLLQSVMQVQQAAAIALFYLLHLLWTRFRKRAEKHERYFLLFLSQLALLPIFYTGGWPAVTQGLISVGVSLCGTLSMQSAIRTVSALDHRHVLTDIEQIGLSGFFGVLLLSLADATAFGFSAPVILLLIFSMTAALARGLAGVAVSVALSAVLTIGGDFTLTFVGGIAACTLAGAALRKMDNLGVLGGFVGCSLLVGTYVFTASHTINLQNLSVAGAAFLLVPREQLLAICAYLDADKNRERYAQKAIRRIRERTASDMSRTAEVCREVAGLFSAESVPPDTADARMQWTAQAASGVCADCTLRVYCWRDGMSAAKAVVQLLESLERGERIRIRRPFDPSCKYMQQMASAAWQAQNQYLVQKAMQKQTAEQYAFVHRQLAGIGDVLDTLSRRVQQDRWLDEELELLLMRGFDRRGLHVNNAEAAYPDGKLSIRLRFPTGRKNELPQVLEAAGQILRRPIRCLDMHTEGKQCIVVIEEAHSLRAELGAATSAISKSGVSGDSTGERRLPLGRTLFALSDGMGAGETARSESESAIRLLFDLYSAGLTRDVALASVNKLLLQRKTDMYATLDALYLNLDTGSAEFIKYGAPPTFIRRGERLHMVASEAPPVGIVPDAEPAIAQAQLRRDDVVLMFSDGALDALGDQTQSTVLDVLRQEMDMERAAHTLLERAAARGQEDDMTVMVIKIA